ncbi:P-loop NTPase fold protein [Bacillus mycoides]|uniref:P-loop NTPase fold protein n=1 Tax=Bacillus mycoides TaxID=1405 RepID=UPI001C011C5D|nr:P-loop NTPase fold protein [Bacillus mycoides]QWI92712.1 hypothetical protein J5W00_29175 [Bacillus mycoides]QWJ03622.1 hypothetical protein J5V93_29335 [Bacillus mycoides]
MKKYVEVVKDYLERPRTNYALMISGDWGNGKTYFLKNSIFPELENMKKKPIYITLNGLSTTEEISKQIYLETSLFSNEKIKKLTESKTIKHITQFSKVIHNAATIFNLSGNSENSIDYEELIDIKDNFVLCFDDLERCKIEITEILGYINNFVEHDAIKTIIIGNEKEIKDIDIEQHKELKMLTAISSLGTGQELEKNRIFKQLSSLFAEQKRYDVIKEKVIGKTLFYVPDISIIIDDIITEYKESNTKNYYNFLKENKEDILYVFNQSSRKNIRILRHALSDFTKIHQALHNELEENQYQKELISKYFVPALISSIEYRTGNFDSEFLTETSTTKISIPFFTINGQATELQVIDKYLKNYTKQKELYLSEAINTYIASSIFDIDILIKESKNIIQTWYERDNTTNIESSIQKLSNRFFELENNEFEQCVQDVLNNVATGFYPLEHYKRIFYQIELFSKDSLLDKSIEEIKLLFKKGIADAHPDLSTDDRFYQFYIQENVKSSDLKYIEDLVKKREEHVKDTNLKTTVTAVMNLLQIDVEEFTKQYYALTTSDKYQPIMQYIDIENFSSQITNLSNQKIISILRLFRSIYNFSNIKDFFEEDYKYISQLADSLEKSLSAKKSVSKFVLEKLITELREIASNLN